MAWMLWLGAAIVLAIVEMITVDFFFLMLAGGALAGMVTAMITTEVWIQVVAFAAAATLLLLMARPAAKTWMESRSPGLRTNAKALVGKTAVVVVPVNPAGGRVKLVGEVWTARTAQPHESFEEGETVLVVKIDGAYAVVSSLPPAGEAPTHY